MDKTGITHRLINSFDPVVSSQHEDWRDYLYTFDAGAANISFTEFLKNEWKNAREDGTCATYVIVNLSGINNDGNPDIVGYFSIATNAVPYISRIYDDDLKTYDEETWGISVLEIKMFAINVSYQDVFYTMDNISLPISAWCLNSIIDYAKYMIENVIGFKALYLHSVPEAKQFYLRNGFQEIEKNMMPLKDIDSDMPELWMPLKKINMTYDE